MTAKEVSMELRIPVTKVWSFVCNSEIIHNRPNELDFSDFRNIKNHFSSSRNGVKLDYARNYA